jgi:hypothetical protein
MNRIQSCRQFVIRASRFGKPSQVPQFGLETAGQLSVQLPLVYGQVVAALDKFEHVLCHHNQIWIPIFVGFARSTAKIAVFFTFFLAHGQRGVLLTESK